MRGAFVFGSVVLATGIAVACGSSVPMPSYVAQPTSALSPVPFPPPPARAEQISKQPDSDAVWVDGEWVWQTRRYAWRKGRWIIPPAGARFAPWTAVRDKTGNLYVATGVWRNANGEEMVEPAAVGERGKPRGGAVVSADGDAVRIGRPASSAGATFGQHDAAARRESDALDASGPPTLASDVAVTDQLLGTSAAERAPVTDASTP